MRNSDKAAPLGFGISKPLPDASVQLLIASDFSHLKFTCQLL